MKRRNCSEIRPKPLRPVGEIGIESNPREIKQKEQTEEKVEHGARPVLRPVIEQQDEAEAEGHRQIGAADIIKRNEFSLKCRDRKIDGKEQIDQSICDS